MEPERRMHMRRSSDKESCAGCDALAEKVRHIAEEREADILLQKQELEALRREVMSELKMIRAQGATQLEIMTAWNNAKGFVKSVQTIGRVMTWMAKISAVGAFLWAAMHFGGNGGGGGG